MPRRDPQPFYFEDFVVGMTIPHGGREVSEADIIAFAREFDPQPVHLKPVAQETALPGGLVASGWHVACIFTRLMCDSFLIKSACMGSPGIESLKWVMPVRSGDVVHARSTVLRKRPSRTRPEMGIVTFRQDALNGAGALVMRFVNPILFRRRRDVVHQRDPAPAASVTVHAEMFVGEKVALGSYRFTAERIKRFAAMWDPQDFHVDEATATGSSFGGLIASGWHTASAAARLHVDSFAPPTKTTPTKGHERQPHPGWSRGFDHLKWLKPVHAGDCVTFSAQRRKREMRSLGWLVRTKLAGVNQKGEDVFSIAIRSFIGDGTVA